MPADLTFFRRQREFDGLYSSRQRVRFLLCVAVLAFVGFCLVVSAL